MTKGAAWRGPILTLAAAATLGFNTPAAAEPAGRWLSAWATAVAPGKDAGADTAPGAETTRQVVRVSASGRRIRLRLSNDHGAAPLRVSAVRVTRGAMTPGGGLPQPRRDLVVTFGGAPAAVIPAFAYMLSDPVDLPVDGGEALTISMTVDARPARATLHPLALTTGYVAPGAQAAASDLRDARVITEWRQLTGVEVELSDGQSGEAIAVLGDSITDGHGAGLDAEARWTDVLAGRLRATQPEANIAILNLGLAGGRLMRDGAGPSGLSRLDRDVLSQPGLSTLIMLIGVNDLGLISREGPVTLQARAGAVEGVIAGYAQVIARARRLGVRVIGVTLPPFGGTRVYRSDAAADEDRRRVNAWIRGPGRFDAVIEFDTLLADPAAPDRLLPRFDSGDHLHPSEAAYRAMGEAALASIVGPVASGR